MIDQLEKSVTDIGKSLVKKIVKEGQKTTNVKNPLRRTSRVKENRIDGTLNIKRILILFITLMHNTITGKKNVEGIQIITILDHVMIINH